MRISEIMTPSFRELRQELGLPRPAKAVVQVSADSDFCREVVARGWLTEEQMAHAAERYRLGRSKSGRCIFWMIDEMGRVYDGHIGNSWVYDAEGQGARAAEGLAHGALPARFTPIKK